LQAARSASQPTPQALQSAIHAAHAVWKGKVAAENVVALANHATRLLRWRFLGGLGLKLVLPILITLIGISAVQKWFLARPDARIERLGLEWGAVDRRVASVRQTPFTAASQAAMLQEANAIGREYSRIMQELNPLLGPPDDRARMARFFTAELGQTLNLDARQKAALFTYLLSRLAPGPPLREALQALAADTPAEAAHIKAMLSPNQRQLFDQTYGADGSGLFAYAKAVTSQKIETSAPQ